MAARTSQDEDAAREAAYRQRQVDRRTAIDNLIGFRIDGMLPFGPSKGDLASSVLSQARGLSVFLATCFREADDRADSDISTLRDVFTAQAFDTVGTLISLAMFAESEGVA